MRQKVSEPTKGSFMILKASIDSGSSSEARRSVSASVFGSMPLMAGTSTGRRQEVDDAVEQRLDALVLEGRAAEDRREPDVAGALADQLAKLVVVGHTCPRDSLPSPARRLRRPVSIIFSRYSSAWACMSAGNLDDVPLGAERLVAPDQGLHLDQVDDALELVLGADRQLHDDRHGRRGGS